MNYDETFMILRFYYFFFRGIFFVEFVVCIDVHVPVFCVSVFYNLVLLCGVHGVISLGWAFTLFLLDIEALSLFCLHYGLVFASCN